MLAAAGAICAPVLAARAIPGAIGSPGILEDAVGRASIILAAVISDGFGGSAIALFTLIGELE